MDCRQELSSLKRGLRVLSILAQERTISVTEAARKLDLPRTTTERIMITLERERYVHRDPDSKRYALAPRILGLAGGFSIEDRLVQAARPLMFAKTSQIGWPLAVAVALGDQMVIRVTTDSATSLGLHKRNVGSEIAMASCSSGILHLAYLSKAERAAQINILQASDDTSQILARNRDRLDYHINEARNNGFFIGPDLGKERAVSVPIFHDGRIRAVLLMMYIARGMKYSDLVSHFVPQLQALSDTISKDIAVAEVEAAGLELPA